MSKITDIINKYTVGEATLEDPTPLWQRWVLISTWSPASMS